MVRFTNIRWDDNFIYAVAEDSNERGMLRNVVVSRREEKFTIDGGIIGGDIVKALWWLQDKVNGCEISSERSLTINWG